MLSIVMNLDVMSWCVLLWWCVHDVYSSAEMHYLSESLDDVIRRLCVLKSRALSSMKPYIYLKILYSSFLGVLCFIGFILNSKASLFQPCSKSTHWPAWRVQFLCSDLAWVWCCNMCRVYSNDMLTELSLVLSVRVCVCAFTCMRTCMRVLSYVHV